MNKKIRSSLAAFLLIGLLGSLFLPAAAAEETEAPAEKQITISSMEDFEEFARNCVRDVYSRNLTVTLKTDLDFTGREFKAIPSFSGTFQGNRHTIKGLHLNTEGSVQGLFRYLTQDAVVQDLTVYGEIRPEGSANLVGSIAGSNAGRIVNCKFQGTVAGTQSVGGIAGENRVTGIIENCMVSGSVTGSHFAGGMAGENLGTIRECKNLAGINTREEDNKIENIRFDPEFLLGKEAIDTVTDLGGIAGTTSGVIRDCVNHGKVGYPHMGYNLGGIAGSQKGYVADCKNQGTIQGRKEIGGIAGQQEPVIEIAYTQDTLQILRGQLANTSALANRASSNIKGNAENLGSHISSLHGQAQSAIEAVGTLIPHDGEFPDRDTVTAAHNTLSSSVGAMEGTIRTINDSAQSVVGTAAADIRAINQSIGAISHTLDTAAEHLGGTVTDISDEDTEENLSGKIENSHNTGHISGDLNVGGIVGAAAWENDMEPEDDYTVSGDRSLNFDSRLRAVILGCTNSGRIEAKKKFVGGIAGNLSLGLIRSCQNTGLIDAQTADYAGGIAGTSLGYIRSCNVKAKIHAGSYVGGIAGTAVIVSDCRSTVKIEDGIERLGSVLGKQTDDPGDRENPIHDNFYLPLADHLGAIDGIDYYEKADSLPKEEFLELEDLSSIFFNATMLFQYPDGSTQKLVVPLGDVVPESKIPAPPRKEGYLGKWDQLEDLDLEHMFFNVTLEAEYVPTNTVLQSDAKDESGKPILLAEGIFGERETVSIEKWEGTPAKHSAEQAWLLPDLGTEDDTVIHLLIPRAMEKENARILVMDEQGDWTERESRLEGSYLVFTAGRRDQAAAIYESHRADAAKLITAAGTAILIILLILILVIRKKHKKKSLKKKTS